MKLLFALLIIIFFLSCGKNDDPSQPVLSPTRTALLAHSWVQDSVVTIINGGNRGVIYPTPKPIFHYGLEVYSTTYESGSRRDTTFYELEESHKIYYWYNGGAKNPNQYYSIITLTDNSFVTMFPNNPASYQFFHAQ